MIDRCNYLVTNSILFLCAITVAAKQYVGEPLQCWVPAEFKVFNVLVLLQPQRSCRIGLLSEEIVELIELAHTKKKELIEPQSAFRQQYWTQGRSYHMSREIALNQSSKRFHWQKSKRRSECERMSLKDVFHTLSLNSIFNALNARLHLEKDENKKWDPFEVL